MKSTYILGINSAYHELSAALIRDGVLVAAVEEERFSRIKHGKTERDDPSTLPVQSIAYCLGVAGITWEDVAEIGISIKPEKRLANIGVDAYFDQGDWGSKEGEERFQRNLAKLPRRLSTLAGYDISSKIRWIDHHLAHAASSFLVSPYEEAAILAIDGIGEFATKDANNSRRKSLRVGNRK